MFKTYK